MAVQFITLMADLDNESQKRMAGWYAKLRQYGFEGKQTSDVPYHISLASFSLDKEKEVAAEVEKLAVQFAPIPVHISHIGMFAGGNVLFGAPDMNPPGLLALHDAIRTETIDRYPWTPHSTILLDEPETIQKALPIFMKFFQPFLATVTRLHLCAFWPTREIVAAELGKKQQILHDAQECGRNTV